MVAKEYQGLYPSFLVHRPRATRIGDARLRHWPFIGRPEPCAAPVVQILVESGVHRFAAGADHEDELLERMHSLQTMAPFFTFVVLASGRAGWKPGPLGASRRENQNQESPT